MTRAINRVALALLGLALLCAGGVVMAAGVGWPVPSWWPYAGPDEALLTTADRVRWSDQSWWWPTVIAVLAVLLVLTLWWVLAQFRRGRLRELAVGSGDGNEAVLRGGALEQTLEDEAGALDGVAGATVRLTGRKGSPVAHVRLRLEPYASPQRALSSLSGETLAEARDSAGLDELPAEVRLSAAKHGAERVT